MAVGRVNVVGGSKINGVNSNYIIEAGYDVNSGDFVEVDNNGKIKALDSSPILKDLKQFYLTNAAVYSYGRSSIFIKLSANKFLACVASYIYYIFTVDPVTGLITQVGSTIQNTSYTVSGLFRLDDTRVLAVNGSNAFVITVGASTLTFGTKYNFPETMLTQNIYQSDNLEKFFAYSTNYLYAISVSGTAVSYSATVPVEPMTTPYGLGYMVGKIDAYKFIIYWTYNNSNYTLSYTSYYIVDISSGSAVKSAVTTISPAKMMVSTYSGKITKIGDTTYIMGGVEGGVGNVLPFTYIAGVLTFSTAVRSLGLTTYYGISRMKDAYDGTFLAIDGAQAFCEDIIQYKVNSDLTINKLGRYFLSPTIIANNWGLNNGLSWNVVASDYIIAHRLRMTDGSSSTNFYFDIFVLKKYKFGIASALGSAGSTIKVIERKGV